MPADQPTVATSDLTTAELDAWEADCARVGTADMVMPRLIREVRQSRAELDALRRVADAASKRVRQDTVPDYNRVRCTWCGGRGFVYDEVVHADTCALMLAVRLGQSRKSVGA